ncbi:MAG: Smr/MutS family protein [Bacteroidetes bacterium]|nr:Smr/MutS family protein [Bacteroidota bacterium]
MSRTVKKSIEHYLYITNKSTTIVGGINITGAGSGTLDTTVSGVGSLPVAGQTLMVLADLASQSDVDTVIDITGTDPAEGSALAAAILLTLKKVNSIVFSTTHHGSLKILANSVKGIQNASMQFDQENLRPTYIFEQGLPGSSYAFEIAERIGFDEQFFKIAKQNLNTDQHKVENFLIDIEKKAAKLNEKLKKLEIENARLQGLSNLYEKNLDKLKSEKDSILQKVKIDAEEYLDDMNKQIEKVVKKIRETKADREVIKETKQTIKRFKETVKSRFPKNKEIYEKQELEIGDNVRIKDSNTIGEIIELNKSKNQVTILTGGLRINTSLLTLIKTKKTKMNSEKSYYDYKVSELKVRLDIRGKRPDEVEYTIVKFIDEAYFSGQQKVEILHGKGTGVLRALVSELLKNNENVKDFYPAVIQQGGDGVTIAEIK